MHSVQEINKQHIQHDRKIALLFPSNFFNTSVVDEDMQNEWEAAKATGLFDVYLFGYDSWFNNKKLILDRVPEQKLCAVYRGWMMLSEDYDQFYQDLLAKNIELITPPKSYQKMHEFPYIYPEIELDTAPIAIYPLHERIDVEELKSKFKRFMVKDYVKSVKGSNFPMYFDSSITQDAFDQCMTELYKMRGQLLTGGICVKEYLDLKKYGDKTNEYRVFVLNHHILSISRNSLQGDYTPLPPDELIEKYLRLPSPFYTIDIAELADGSWNIIETGDGSVSGPSDGQNLSSFYRAMFIALTD